MSELPSKVELQRAGEPRPIAILNFSTPNPVKLLATPISDDADDDPTDERKKHE